MSGPRRPIRVSANDRSPSSWPWTSRNSTSSSSRPRSRSNKDGRGSPMIEKKKTRIKIRNEEKILDAALKLFSTFGFHGTTMEKIAELADMSQPNLHNYFKTKAD